MQQSWVRATHIFRDIDCVGIISDSMSADEVLLRNPLLEEVLSIQLYRYDNFT